MVAFFMKKILLVQTLYKTHNNKIWDIIKVLKTYYYYIKDNNNEFSILINHKIISQFINI